MTRTRPATVYCDHEDDDAAPLLTEGWRFQFLRYGPANSITLAALSLMASN